MKKKGQATGGVLNRTKAPTSCGPGSTWSVAASLEVIDARGKLRGGRLVMLLHKIGMLDQSGETLLGLFALLLDLCELSSVLNDQALSCSMDI